MPAIVQYGLSPAWKIRLYGLYSGHRVHRETNGNTTAINISSSHRHSLLFSMASLPLPLSLSLINTNYGTTGCRSRVFSDNELHELNITSIAADLLDSCPSPSLISYRSEAFISSLASAHPIRNFRRTFRRTRREYAGFISRLIYPREFARCRLARN